MCDLYSETKGQDAIRGLFRVLHDRTGNLPSFPAIFPDQMAPIVRNAEGGNRELVLARWGMPGASAVRWRAGHKHPQRLQPALARPAVTKEPLHCSGHGVL